MIELVLLPALTISGVYAAGHWPLLRGRPFRQGLWFGMLTVLVLSVSGVTADFAVSIGVADAQVLTAALCFGPVPALIAGLAAAAVRMLLPLAGIGSAGWLPGGGVFLLMTLYGVVLSRFILNRRNPGFICGAVAAAFGGVLRSGLFLLLSDAGAGAVFESIRLAVLPLLGISALTAGLAAAIALPSGNRIRREFSVISLCFLLFGLTVGTTIVLVLSFGVNSADGILRQAVRHVNLRINDLLGFSLDRIGRHIAGNLGNPAHLTQFQMRQIAVACGLDELAVYNSRGRLVVSSNAGARVPDICKELVGGRGAIWRPAGYAPDMVNTEDRLVRVLIPDYDGFLQLKYCKSRFEREFGFYFLPRLSEYAVNATGYLLIADAGGTISAAVRLHPDAIGRKLTGIGFPESGLSRRENEFFTAVIFGVPSRCVLAGTVGKWRIYVVQPYTDTCFPVLRVLFISVLSLFFFCALVCWLVRRTSAVRLELAEMQAQDKLRVLRDLEQARRVQLSELRDDNPDTPAYRLRAEMLPAREVSGDFYDYYEIAGRRLLFCIADVSGKGMPAAIFMMKAKTLLRINALRCSSLLDIVRETNLQLCRNNEARMFVTVWSGIFDPASGELEYICCGHNPPVIVRPDGMPERVPCLRALPLGIRPEWKYQVQKLQLTSGDRLFLYTDGVTEAMDIFGGLYGESRMYQALAGVSASGSLIDGVRRDLSGFTGGASRSDDITMLCLQIK